MSKTVCTHHENVKVKSRPPLQGGELRLAEEMVRSLARPEAVVERVVVGDKFLAVVAGSRVGLSSLLGARADDEGLRQVHTAEGRTVAELARNIMSCSAFCVSLGLAAVNAANAPGPESASAAPGGPADELIVALGQNGKVGLVGEFPFVSSLRERVGEMHLFELRDVPGAVPPQAWDETLAGLDVLAVTGTALLTRRMAYFLSRARQATVLVLGPSTPLSNSLFEFGADYLCGSVVTDPEPVLDGIRAGLPFHQVKKNGGIRFTRWTREDLPG
ncbi:Rossmann-like domain-containing protein [Desulfomicrobium escambiense]|uniref:Rossmann-like domain-containing protein n=1 Tax=Desulfomicrobium escambiense TaxID=29503 RepID=UPI0009FF86F1|nr:DUF364 domain-containing protein [Desulfomicrobium escambiense]